MTRPHATLFLLATIAGCRAADAPLDGWATLEANMTTAATVVWESSEPGPSWVEYGVDGSPVLATPTVDDGSTTHQVLVQGLPPLSQISWRAVTSVDGQEEAVGGTLDTPNLPASLPGFTVDVKDASQVSPERYFLGITGGSEYNAFVLDREGQWAWYYQSPDTSAFSGKVVQPDGSTDILIQTWSYEPSDPAAQILRVAANGTKVDALSTPGSHHAFTSLPDGTLAVLEMDIRSWTDPAVGEPLYVVGDSIVEYAPDGSTRKVFSTWDWLEVEQNDRFFKSQYRNACDWTHGNSLDWEPENQTYRVSFAHLDTIAEVDRESGQVVEAYGRYGMPVDDTSTPFQFQHAPVWTEDGTLLMSSIGADGVSLAAMEYAVDTEAGSLHQVWTGGEEMGLGSMAGGQAIRLSNGNTLLNGGTTGVVVELNPDGEVVWALMSDLGTVIWQVTPISDLYAGL